jgi:hypothetical protein
LPGQDPTKSNATLVAPHGTIDAGAAGIRVAGNLNLIALQVLNAFNVQVSGTALGLPTTEGPPVAALATASNVAGANQVVAPPPSSNNNQASIIIVEFVGFGGGDTSSEPNEDGDHDKKKDQRSYDPNSMFRVIGNGELNERQKNLLTPDAKSKL